MHIPSKTCETDVQSGRTFVSAEANLNSASLARASAVLIIDNADCNSFVNRSMVDLLSVSRVTLVVSTVVN
jgi:hypothetical protein